ncbi:MAG: signal peptidase I [Bryobacterales bacterium]|nr:signal peptidase I [Bryobacterales bacterium]
MKMPVFARVGVAVAAVLALLLWFAAAENPVTGIPVALLFTFAAMGLWKGKCWSGYGPALLILIFAGAAIVRLRDSPLPPGQLATAMSIALAAAVLLFVAGRSVAVRGRSSPAPWLTVCAATVAFLSLFQPMIVPTGAMEDTILQGDSLLARRVFSANPARGEVVLHRYPVDRRQVFLKRVVGLPGDRIRLQDKRLFVNGVEVPEPYVKHISEYLDPYRDQFPKNEPAFDLFPGGEAMLRNHVRGGEVVVPEGKLFVLGDNRDNSLDSRYWGFIDRGMITGKPVMVLFSADLSPQDRGSGMTGLLAPLRHARWGRTFKLLTSI